jgi:hypothetical protein
LAPAVPDGDRTVTDLAEDAREAGYFDALPDEIRG